MTKVFVSSVIEGFEGFRQAAKEAVEDADMMPVMVEDFPSQPYSAEQACTKGVQEADLCLLLLGQRYGYVPDGSTISVTHTEYREAIGMHKPMLAFIQHTEKERKQQDFVKEVEDYGDGLFRKKFSNPDELKRQITAALDDWKKSQTSSDEAAFLSKVGDTLDIYHPREYQRNEDNGDPCGVVAFWGQPDQTLDLDKIDYDTEFKRLCELGIMPMKYGYNNGYNTGGHYRTD